MEKDMYSMKANRISAIILVLIFNFFQTAYSQLSTLNADNFKNVKIDALSDGEIKTYYQRVTSAGFTQEQLLKMTAERGLPGEEVVKLKERLDSIYTSKKIEIEKDTLLNTKNKRESDIDRKMDKDAINQPIAKVVRDTSIFGSELFLQKSLVFEPNLRIPTPANYILGPDDEVQVNVYGYSEQTYKLTVTAEGNIYIPNVGPIKVVGQSVEEASDRIRKKLASTIYKAINSGQTKVDIAIGKIRSIRVTVIGQATQPGTYTVSSLTTLFNLLYQCGGPSDNGSYRNIEIIRGNKVIRNVDLYRFLTKGDREDNILLEEQDVVRIPYYNRRAILKGQAKRKGKYELIEKESVANLFNYAGGFTDSAYQKEVKLTRLTDAGISIFSVKNSDFSNFSLKSGDELEVGKIRNEYLNRVTVSGAVYRPGDFELKEDTQLKNILELAGGIKPDAFLDRAYIRRLNANLTTATVSFSVQDILSGKEKIILKKEDEVVISSIFDLRDQQTISIEGEIRNPGTYAFSQKIMLRDLILKSGGFTDAANPNTVEISRRKKDIDITKSIFQQTEIIRVDITEGLSKNENDVELQPFDAVIVRSDPAYFKHRFVYIDGQVMSAGRYVLESTGERISHLLKRAGGFKGAADSNSIIVKRVVHSSIPQEEREKIVQRMLNINTDSILSNEKLKDTYFKNVELLGVNLQKVRKEPGGNEDLILEEGDVITVSRTSNLVRISGEVHNHTLLAYEPHANAKDYIRASGGFTEGAKKRAVFVIYPNGRSKQVRQLLFFRKYPAVTPRAEVFVPAKGSNKKNFGTGEWIAISSIIASLATMLVALITVVK